MSKTTRLGWTYPLPALQALVAGIILWVNWDSFGLHFAQASALWGLLLLPLLSLLAIGYWHWRERLKRRLGDSALMEAMSATHSWPRHVARTGIFLLGLGLLIIGLARPQWGQTDAMIKRTGVDIVFAIDLSRSMQAQDVSPSRLQAAKDEISTTLGLLGGDRAGLVVFTAVSFAQSPLTTDYGALRFYLNKLKPDQMPFGGTNIGLAIGDSVELLTGKRQQSFELSPTPDSKQDETPEKIKRAKTQLVVLITDGEDHESDPIASANLAKQNNIHLITVGFGSTHGERIPIYREDGTILGYKKSKDGEFVYSRLDESTLKKLSDLTGGIYIHYQGENSVANSLISYIDQLEKSELETLLRKRYKDRFQWFVIPGLLLLLISMLIGERRVAPPRRYALTAMVFALSLSMFGCEAPFTHPMSAVEEGNAAIEDKDYTKALERYQAAERETPANPRLHYDLGRAHLGLEQYERAQDYFTRALETQDKELRFLALYNLALTLEKQGQLKQAYETMRDAVTGLASDEVLSQRDQYRQAVHNLEVLYQKLYPPCSKLEDAREDNDTAATATRQEEPELKDGVLCGLDDDWYAIPVLLGTQIEVTATFKDLRAEPDPERAFLPQAADLQIALFEASGKEVITVDQGLAQQTTDTSSYGSPGSRTTTRKLMRFTVTEQMLGGTGSALMLKVSAADELEFKYELKIDAIPPCSAIDDKLEPNNSLDAAKPLKAGSEQLHLCAEDEDWYAIDLELGDTLFVDIQPSEDVELKRPPSLSLEVLDPKGKRVITQGKPESGMVVASLWDVTEPGRYLVRVRGQDQEQQGPYAMQTYIYAPCPLGDDRYEDNDDSSTAAMLDPKAPLHRYLRICPGESDYYRLPLGEPEGAKDAKDTKAPQGQDDKKAQDDKPKTHKLSLGLSKVVRPVSKNAKPSEDADEPLTFVLLSPNGDQILAESVELPPTAAPAKQTSKQGRASAGKAEKTQKAADASSKDTEIRLDRILQQEGLTQEQALIHVKGPAMFYHLVQLNPQSGQQDSPDEQKDKQEDKNEDKSEQQKEKDQDQKEEKSPEQEQDQPKDDKSDPNAQEDPKDEKSQDGKEPEEQQEDDAAPKEGDAEGDEPPKDEQRPDGKKGEAKDDKDPEMRRIEDILRALEETDDNFQMRKALQNMPGRYIEKDW